MISNHIKRHGCAILASAALFFLTTTRLAAQSPQDVLTYHGDNFRTGWFSAETQLTASNVTSGSFGLLAKVPLDGRVDAEPLFVSQLTIGGAPHNVVYIATEHNTLYAIDSDTAAILWQHNFGTPVPYTYKNSDDNVYPLMGIVSTPVIDRTAGVMYLVADTFSGSVDTFWLHAVSLTTGKDVLHPTAITFTGTLADGTMWTFNPQYHLQRPGLLEANGNIYIAFGSNGDIVPNASRGTILRYSARTLKQVSGSNTNRLPESSNPYYLTAIWQSGYAPAADATGDVYFSTGNSNPGTPSFSKSWNHPNSIVRLSPDLGTLLTSFTPSDYFPLDQVDSDLGSGGAMVLPDQPGSVPHLAVAGGKDGRAFLLNRDNMGGYTPNGPDKVLQSFDMGPCWCGPAYFVGSDTVPRVVTAGQNGVTTWKLQTAPSTQVLQEFSTGSSVLAGLPEDGGAIPVISSNSTTPGTAVIWLVRRPATTSDQNPGTVVTLLAYSASNMQQLVSLSAGTWRHAVNSNANIVPTVANGKVFVASNMQLQIFGLLTPQAAGKAPAAQEPMAVSTPDVIACPSEATSFSPAGEAVGAQHVFHGTVCRASAAELTLALRNGRTIALDISHLAQARKMRLTPGRPLVVRATIDGEGFAHAQEISPSHEISAATPADR